MTTSIFRKSLLVAALATAWGPMTLAVLGADPVIHADWDDAGSPVLGIDYFVTTSSPASVDFPDVELDTGSGSWQIWSTDTDNPNDIGDIGVISCPHAAYFTVTLGSDTEYEGARNIKGIILDPQGAGSDSNYTNLISSGISGTLTGDLFLQESSGTGGEIGLQIIGGVTGDITAASILNLIIVGNVTGNTEIGQIINAGVGFGGLDGNFEVTGELAHGVFGVSGNFSSASTITIADMTTEGGHGSLIQFATEPGAEFAGDLVLGSGLRLGQMVTICGDFASTASIDLNDLDMAGEINLLGGGGGTILKVDDVTATGTVVLAYGSTSTFSGSATFASVAAGARIETTMGGIVSGMLDITNAMAGDIDIDGDVTSLGTIDIGGNFESTGLIRIGGKCAGDISVAVKFEGDLGITGSLTSTGSITASAGSDGDISVGSNLAGAVTIAGALSTTGRVLVDGLISGSVDIALDTATGSLIQAIEGLDTGGTIEINTSQGDYDAHGAIVIGENTSPLPDITFYGCIRIYDESGTGNGGDLEGVISIIGCHDLLPPPDEDVNICIDGDVNGTLGFRQAGCDETATNSCSGCSP